MFRHELVSPKMPDPSGIPPHVREMVGPQACTVGIIAKQPGSNWLHRKHLAEKRHTDAQRKIILGGAKELADEITKNEFQLKTDKKNLKARLKKKVQDGLQAAEDDLEYRRNMLKELLLREESEYTQEYVHKAQTVKDDKVKDVQKRIQEINLKKHAEEQRIVEEKRLQQYRIRCEQLRIKTSEFQRKELNEIHFKQMEDKLAKQEAERERDVMYCQLMHKDIEAMKEYEERIERERQKRVKNIAEVYKKQLEGKRLFEEEQKRLKKEEAKLIEKLKEEIEQERQEEKEEERKKRKLLQDEMREQLKRAKEALVQKNKEEKEMDATFCKLIQDELNREKSKTTDTRRQMRREQELFTAHLLEIEKKRKEEERSIEEMRQSEMNKILKKKAEKDFQACQAKENLKKEVLNQRKIQVEEKKIKAQKDMERKKLDECNYSELFEKFKLEQEIMRKEYERKKKMYGEELKRQEELLKIQREKKIEEDEIRLRNELMAEEQYLRKVDLTMDILCDRKHPFMKKLEGETH